MTMQLAQAMDATPWRLDLSFPDLTTLLPFILICLTSVVLTTGWLLAVSRYTSKRTVHR